MSSYCVTACYISSCCFFNDSIIQSQYSLLFVFILGKCGYLCFSSLVLSSLRVSFSSHFTLIIGELASVLLPKPRPVVLEETAGLKDGAKVRAKRRKYKLCSATVMENLGSLGNNMGMLWWADVSTVHFHTSFSLNQHTVWIPLSADSESIQMT